MNEILKSKLESVVNDDLLIQAFKAVFDERIEKELPCAYPTNENTLSDNNELLGEKYRAYLLAKIIIKQAFKDLDFYKVGARKTKTFNKEK